MTQRPSFAKNAAAASPPSPAPKRITLLPFLFTSLVIWSVIRPISYMDALNMNMLCKSQRKKKKLMLYFPLQFNFWLKKDTMTLALLILLVVQVHKSPATLLLQRQRGLGEQSACFQLKYNDSTCKGSPLCC